MKKPDYIIFTDGSVRRGRYRQYAGYGVVLYNCDSKEYASFGGELGNRSVLFSEMYAIHRAVSTISDKIGLKRNVSVLILGDNTEALAEYRTCLHLARSSKYCHDDVYGGTRYKNLVEITVKNILRHPNIRFKFAHINAHKDIDSSCDRELIQRKLKNAGYNINHTTAKAIIKMNDMADHIAKGYSKQCIKESKGFMTLRPSMNYYGSMNARIVEFITKIFEKKKKKRKRKRRNKK